MLKLFITSFSLFAFPKRYVLLLLSLELCSKTIYNTACSTFGSRGFYNCKKNFNRRCLSFCCTKFFVFFTINEFHVDAYRKKRFGDYTAFD